MTSQRLYDIAVANDDPCDLDTCPGCGQDITGWRDHWFHYPPGMTTRRGNRFTDAVGDYRTCRWNHDYLVARIHRRRHIAEGVDR